MRMIRADFITPIARSYVIPSLSKIQNSKAAKVFIFIRHKKWYIFISVCSFVAQRTSFENPEHFEFQGYGGARHKAKIEFNEKYILVLRF